MDNISKFKEKKRGSSLRRAKLRYYHLKEVCSLIDFISFFMIHVIVDSTRFSRMTQRRHPAILRCPHLLSTISTVTPLLIFTPAPGLDKMKDQDIGQYKRRRNIKDGRCDKLAGVSSLQAV